MVGNDVVDLRDPESDATTLHPRFDRRVFADVERFVLSHVSRTSRERWAMWAGKEAAYKLARQLDEKIVFSPPRFVVELEAHTPHASARAGRVRHPNGPFDVWLHEGEDHVHAVALLPGTDPATVLTGVERPDLKGAFAGPEGPGRAARQLARARVSAVLGLPYDALDVRKRGRIPELHLSGSRIDGDLSISHHGAFVAFAYHADAEAVRLGRAS